MTFQNIKPIPFNFSADYLGQEYRITYPFQTSLIDSFLNGNTNYRVWQVDNTNKTSYEVDDVLALLETSGYTKKYETAFFRGDVTKTEAIFVYTHTFVTVGRTSLSVYSNKEEMDVLVELIKTAFTSKEKNWGCWMYMDKQRELQTKSVPIAKLDQFRPELYPYMDVYKVMDEYMESSASVLILLGEPGTGKTSFINELIRRHSVKNPYIVYDEQTAGNEELFISFMASSSNVMIFEDADNIMSDRVTDNNKYMAKILNMTNGLLATSSKKFIFSANIVDEGSIDHALIRPGRCFDVVRFRPLTASEVQKIAETTGLEPPHQDSRLTASEIINNKSNKHIKQKVGFGITGK